MLLSRSLNSDLGAFRESLNRDTELLHAAFIALGALAGVSALTVSQAVLLVLAVKTKAAAQGSSSAVAAILPVMIGLFLFALATMPS